MSTDLHFDLLSFIPATMARTFMLLPVKGGAVFGWSVVGEGWLGGVLLKLMIITNCLRKTQQKVETTLPPPATHTSPT